MSTNIQIYSNIRIISSEYWYSYSIRCNFQKPNIIRIFEYFAQIFPNICLRKSLEIQRFWKFWFHFLTWKDNFTKISIVRIQFFSTPWCPVFKFHEKYFWELLFFNFFILSFKIIQKYSNIQIFCTIWIFLTERIIFDIRFGWFCLDE